MLHSTFPKIAERAWVGVRWQISEPSSYVFGGEDQRFRHVP
jgi:hypothetical protein